MSHMIIFSCFSNGEEAAFDLARLKTILKTHRCELGRPGEHGYIPVSFPSKNGEVLIGTDEGGIAVDGDRAIEFAIGQPLYDEPMKQLAFALLDQLDLCAYGDGSHLYSARQIDADMVAEDILEECEDGIAIVSSPAELWP